MRFVFVDEAGTSGSRNERFRVVAAVVTHADEQLAKAETAIREVLSSVPLEFRSDFHFHAEDIMNNQKYKDRWRLTDRANLISEIASIPRRMQMPVCFGIVNSDAPPTDLQTKGGFPPNEEQHVLAFYTAIARADRWITTNAKVGEVATLVCEKSHMNKALTKCLRGLRDNPHILQDVRWTKADLERGYSLQDGVLKVTRIRRTIHFVDKSEDDMVWIADACAYGLKRYLSGLSFGDQFCTAIGGGLLNKSDYTGPCSAASTYDPRWQ